MFNRVRLALLGLSGCSVVGFGHHLGLLRAGGIPIYYYVYVYVYFCFILPGLLSFLFLHSFLSSYYPSRTILTFSPCIYSYSDVSYILCTHTGRVSSCVCFGSLVTGDWIQLAFHSVLSAGLASWSHWVDDAPSLLTHFCRKSP